MKSSVRTVGAVPTRLLQRNCACGRSVGVSGACEECRRNGLNLQRHPIPKNDPTEVPPIVYDVLRSPGQPLDPATRAFMEPRFGHDFSDVPVHTDTRVAEPASALNALAYAVGRDPALGTGQYAPGTSKRRQPLAHELTRAMHQSGAAGGVQHLTRLESPSESMLKHEAETQAMRVVRGGAGDQGQLYGRLGFAMLQPRGSSSGPVGVRTTNLYLTRFLPAAPTPQPRVLPTTPGPLTKPGAADLYITVRSPARITRDEIFGDQNRAPHSGLGFYLARHARFKQDEYVVGTLRWTPPDSKPLEQAEEHAKFNWSWASETEKETGSPGSHIKLKDVDTHTYGLSVVPGLDCEENAKRRTSIKTPSGEQRYQPFDRMKSDWTFKEIGKFIDTVTFPDKEIRRTYYFEYLCIKQGSNVTADVQYTNVDRVEKS